MYHAENMDIAFCRQKALNWCKAHNYMIADPQLAVFGPSKNPHRRGVQYIFYYYIQYGEQSQAST